MREPATCLIASALLLLVSSSCDIFNPHPTSCYATPGEAFDVAARNNTLFVALGDSGYLSLDVTNPAAPRLLQRVRVGTARCLALGTSAIYFGVEGKVVALRPPRMEGFHFSPQGDSQTPTALLEDSTRLFVAAADGISVFEVSDSGAAPVRFIPLTGHPTGLARRDSRLFVSLRDWGVRVFNILPGDSLVLDTLQLGKHHRAEGVTASPGGYIIISQGDSGVVTYYTPARDSVSFCGGGGGSDLVTYATAASDGVQEVSVYAADSTTVTIRNIVRRPDFTSSSAEALDAEFSGFTRRICRPGNGYVYTASGEAGVYIIRE